MNLFQIKTGLQEKEQITDFLQDNYISLNCPGIGNLEHVGREQIHKRLEEAYSGSEVELTSMLEALELFVHTMQDGDYVIIADKHWAYLGDLGDYFYDEAYDHTDDGRCHRRGVTWLKSLPHAALNPQAAELIFSEDIVSMYRGPLPGARLDLWFGEISSEAKEKENAKASVDEQTVFEALTVLREALHGPDADRRERAAIAILQYAK